MGREDTNTDDAFQLPIAEEDVRKAASDYPVTFGQVSEVLVDLQNALADDLNSLYEKAWIGGGADNHLFEMEHGVWFALVPPRLYTRYFEPDEIDDDAFLAACLAHEYNTERLGEALVTPTPYANTLKGDLDYSPFFIEFPTGWKMGLQHSRLEMRYLLHHGMTPAEAIDYWALEFGVSRLSTPQAQDSWRAARDVDREAINKTLRQAKEKRNDESRKPRHKEQNIQVAPIDD